VVKKGKTCVCDSPLEVRYLPRKTEKPLPSDKLAETKDSSWIAAQNPEHYTLHLAGSYDLASLMTVAQSIPNQSEVAYYEVNFEGKSWYTLIYGEFEDAQVAKKALQKLPEEIKQWSPLVRKFSEMQQTLKTYN